MSEEPDMKDERMVLAEDVKSFVWKRLPGKIGF
jgi:hypothetical protein